MLTWIIKDTATFEMELRGYKQAMAHSHERTKNSNPSKKIFATTKFEFESSNLFQKPRNRSNWLPGAWYTWSVSVLHGNSSGLFDWDPGFLGKLWFAPCKRTFQKSCEFGSTMKPHTSAHSRGMAQRPHICVGPGGIGKSVSANASSRVLVGWGLVTACLTPCCSVEITGNQIHVLILHNGTDCKKDRVSWQNCCWCAATWPWRLAGHYAFADEKQLWRRHLASPSVILYFSQVQVSWRQNEETLMSEKKVSLFNKT